MPTAREVSDAYRAALLKREQAMVKSLIASYRNTYVRLSDKIKALEGEIMALPEAERKAWKVMRLGRWKALRQQVEDELHGFGVIVRDISQNGHRESITAGLDFAYDSMKARVPAQLLERVLPLWHSFAPEAIESALGYFAEGSPLVAKLNAIAPNGAAMIQDLLTEAISMGYNPRTWASAAAKGLGMPLPWAMNLARTAQLQAYRQATMASYRRNSHVVRGWRWSAAMDRRTCFPAGTMIATVDGERAIEDVNAGDLVLTHTGAYRRVTETMARPYRGDLARVVAGSLSVICTPDHPLLVERQGQLDWVEAGRVMLGDSVICKLQDGADVLNHRFGQVAVQPGVRNAHDAMAPALEPVCFAGIALADCFESVPVSAIYFEAGINSWQVEVNRIPPTREGVFLQKGDVDSFKAQPGVALRLGFANVAPIAADRAMDLVDGRDGTKDLSASWASSHLWRAAALFGAIMPVGTAAKRFAATLAHKVNFGGHSVFAALGATKGVSARVRGWYRKHLAALRTGLGDTAGLMCKIAGSGAKLVWAQAGGLEGGSAVFADGVNFASGPSVITGGATKGVLITQPRGGARKGSAAVLAGHNGHDVPPHDRRDNSISRVAAQCKPAQNVYNLEVEADHSYIANGFVVHNCMSCIAQDGTVHSLDETLDDHHMGRCCAEPITVSWAELGFDIEEPVDDRPRARDWFAEQPEATQRAMFRNNKLYDAWRDGRVTWEQLSKETESDVWGRMLVQASYKDLFPPSNP